MAELQKTGQLSDWRQLDTLSFYESNADSYAQRTSSADLAPIYEQFLPLVPPGGRILDVGCGGGRDLRAFHLRGFKCIGIDPSKRLARIAHEYSGCETLVMGAEDLMFTSSFDGVWACASLLHVPRSQLLAALARIFCALKPAGVMFISMQQGGGEAVAPDGRFFARYSSVELERVVSSAGFVVLKTWVTDDALPIGRRNIAWVNLLARHSGV